MGERRYGRNWPDGESENGVGLGPMVSPAEAKVALSRRFVPGRGDVFARRVEKQKTRGGGVSADVRDRMVPGVCGKPKGKRTTGGRFKVVTANWVSGNCTGLPAG